MTMRENLPLPSFEVEGFRAIRRLSLPELGRVNLFVGKNNAGKTSLLEAIRLYLHRNHRMLPAVIFEILRDHAGFRPRPFTRAGAEPDAAELEAAADAVEALFYGSFEEKALSPIRLTPEPMPSSGLVLRLPWIEEATPEVRHLDGSHSIPRAMFLAPETAILELESEAVTTEFPLDWFVRRTPIFRPGAHSPALMIPASGMESFRIREMWDRVAVSGHEELVEDALRIVVPNLDRILLVGESGRRSVLFKLNGSSRAVPLQSMGDGVNRVFAIAVALVFARGGSLLLDEVENGLHFTVQDEVWLSIFSLARRFDVQVFATSHSWDSIVGFQYAANRSEEEGLLYRLDAQGEGQIDAVRYTEREVEIAAEQRIEVR